MEHDKALFELAAKRDAIMLTHSGDPTDDWPGAYTFDDKIDDSHPVQQFSWEDAVMLQLA